MKSHKRNDDSVKEMEKSAYSNYKRKRTGINYSKNCCSTWRKTK